MRRKKLFIRNSARPDGVFIDISASPILGENDLLEGGIVVFKDITEGVESERSIRQREERLKAQFKGFPIPTYVWKHENGEFILIDYNNAAHHLTRGKVKQILGIKLSELYPDVSDPIRHDILSSFHNKETINRKMKYKFKTTGEEKELNVSYVFIPEDLVVVHTEDITDRTDIERQLLKLWNAVEQTADAVILTNTKGIIEYVNPSFEIITGYKKEETIGKTPNILKSAKYDESFYRNMWQTILSGKPYKEEMMNKKKNGEYFWVQNTITPIKDNNNKITNFVSVIKDITDIKSKEEQEIHLQIAKEIQQQLFTSNVSIPGYDIAGKNYPADETGGDYFDIIFTPEGKLWLTIADVSNHGIGSALIMAGTRAYLRAFIEQSSNPAEVLGKLNNVLHSDLNEFQYVTMLLVLLDTKTHGFEYCGAGHVPGYIINDKGDVDRVLQSSGLPLGYLKNENYINSKIDNLTSGNIVVLFTDGITEAQDRFENEFGSGKLLDTINAQLSEKSEDIINHIYREVCTFTHEAQLEDDFTALICKLNHI